MNGCDVKPIAKSARVVDKNKKFESSRSSMTTSTTLKLRVFSSRIKKSLIKWQLTAKKLAFSCFLIMSQIQRFVNILFQNSQVTHNPRYNMYVSQNLQLLVSYEAHYQSSNVQPIPIGNTRSSLVIITPQKLKQSLAFCRKVKLFADYSCIASE